MKTSRFKQVYNKNASQLHQKVGNALKDTSSPFRNYKIYQEYPVNKINPNYPCSAHRFDWVILDLKIVIECHGQQHFKIASFGGISKEEAVDKLDDQKVRDRNKMNAAIEVGFTYIEIPYKDLDCVTPRYIYQKYRDCFNPESVSIVKTTTTDYHQEQLDRAREYRQQQYRRAKQLKKK